MNFKLKKFLSNFSITLFANLLSMIVSSLIILIVPAFIGVKEYGYWQLFVFYCSYTSYFSFGITDGIYLRNGGKEYDELNKQKIRSQYWVLFFINLFLTFIVTLFLIINSCNFNEDLILVLSCVSAIIIIPRSLITMTMLSVNKIKENAIVLIIDRLIYLMMIFLFFIFKINNFYFIIFADLLAQFVSSVFAALMCKDLVFGKIDISFSEILAETRINFSIGIKIVIAGLASMLIIGIVRMGIEQNWGVEEFAKVSLTLSVCNMLLIFIKAISVVIFPVLCTSTKEALKKVYILSKDGLSIILFAALIFYYPLKIVLSNWLPEYADSLSYMAFLFPISLYESKTQLLLNTYFKVLRKENFLLLINVFTVLLSLISTFITTVIANSIDYAILAIVILLAFRCYCSEFFLFKILEIKNGTDSIVEIIFSFQFIVFNWVIGGVLGMLLYSFSYLLFLIYKKNQLKIIFVNIKKIIKRR